MHLFEKNRRKEKPSFANINMLGTCNLNCYFCLGKDLPEHFNKFRYEHVHFAQWSNFDKFLVLCQDHGIDNIFLTGQNTDPNLYQHLEDLVAFLQNDLGFSVGVRTNAYGVVGHRKTYDMCKGEIGYSAISLDSATSNKICGVSEIPDWNAIIPGTGNCRISIVANRYNLHEIQDMIEFFGKFKEVKYIQLRRVSTDTRMKELQVDAEIFDGLEKHYLSKFSDRLKGNFHKANVFELCGKDVVFWKTVDTSVNSLNYYVDGTVSDEYFIIEGYLKNRLQEER